MYTFNLKFRWQFTHFPLCQYSWIAKLAWRNEPPTCTSKECRQCGKCYWGDDVTRKFPIPFLVYLCIRYTAISFRSIFQYFRYLFVAVVFGKLINRCYCISHVNHTLCTNLVAKSYMRRKHNLIL